MFQKMDFKLLITKSFQTWCYWVQVYSGEVWNCLHQKGFVPVSWGIAGGSQIKGEEYSSALLVNAASGESSQEPGFEGSERPLLPLRT